MLLKTLIVSVQQCYLRIYRLYQHIDNTRTIVHHESKVIDRSLAIEQVMYTTNTGNSPTLLSITYQSKHGYSVGISSDYVTVVPF
jgi:hypothetical protein